jgi:luciferase family oxidoreductase group 1
MRIPLSILDVTPVAAGASSADALRNTLDLARFADRRGFTRFWLAEHHNSPGIAATTPEIMTAVVAQVTESIRVGSGGVMLPNHSPLKVAESFKLLEALYPGRIDLGIGRAPGTDMRTALALRRTHKDLNGQDFPQELLHLQAFASGSFPDGHPYRTVLAYPNDVPLPPIWLLGSSGFSSRLAAQLGAGFSFAHHIGGDNAIDSMLLYREAFEPSAQFPQPHAILAASVICADTDEAAERLALSVVYAFYTLHAGVSRGGLLSPDEVAAAMRDFSREQRLLFDSIRQRHFVGSPATVAAAIGPLLDASQADELMALTMVHDHTARVRSYELLADATW